MTKSYIFLNLIFIFLSIVYAEKIQAQTVGAVGGSKIEKGVLNTELRFGFSLDDESTAQDHRIRTRQQFDYGLTDYYAARLVLFQDKRKADNFEHHQITLDNRFHILDRKSTGFDFGARIFYDFKDGDKKPDTAGIRLVQVIPLSDWNLRFNQFFRREVGEDSANGLSFESRAQITKPVAKDHHLGIESFNNFGNLTQLSGYSAQSHSIGPVLKGKILGLGYETGYQNAISRSGLDHGFKFFLKKSF